MGLSGARISDLIQRTDAALEKSGHVPGSDLEALAPQKKDNVLRLLARKEQLAQLQDPRRQIEEYGTQRWHKEFVRLGDLKSLPSVRQQGAELREMVWRAVPHSLFKRAQLLFSNPKDYVVPRFEVSADGRVRFLDRPDFHRLSIKPCLFAPDRLPDKLVQDLKLADLSGFKGKPVERLEAKAQPAVIQGMKLILEAARPLQPHHHRILIIMPPSEEIAGRYPQAKGVHADISGALLYVRENGARSANGALVAGYYADAPAAQRKTFLETHGYLAEIRKLSELKEDLTTFNARLNTWRTGTPEDEKNRMRAEANKLFSGAVEALRACENRYKVRAHDLLEKVVHLTDSSGRTNIAACMAQVMAAVTSFEKRFREMYPKGGYNQQDQLALEQGIQAHRRILSVFGEQIAVKPEILTMRLRLFGTGRLSDAQIHTDVRGVLSALTINPAPLSRLVLQPYVAFGKALASSYQELETALKARNRDGAQDALVKMAEIVRLSELKNRVDQVRQALAADDQVPGWSVAKALKGALDCAAAPRMVFPKRTVQSCEPPRQKAAEILGELRDLLKPHEADLNPLPAEVLAQMKVLFEKYDAAGGGPSLPLKPKRSRQK